LHHNADLPLANLPFAMSQEHISKSSRRPPYATHNKHVVHSAAHNGAKLIKNNILTHVLFSIMPCARL